MKSSFKNRNRRYHMLLLLLAVIVLMPLSWRGYWHWAEYAQPLSKVPDERIAQILLRQDNQFVHLVRSGSQSWALANMGHYPVPAGTAQNFLTLLRKSRNLGLQAWGEQKIAQANLQTDAKDVVRVQLRDAQNQVIGDWLIGQAIGENEYLARAVNADQIFSLQLLQRPDPKLAAWLGDFWMGLQQADMAAIVLGVGADNAVELVRSDPHQPAWRIENLPKGAELKPDSPITRVPRIFTARMFESAKLLAELKPETDLRWRSQFITTDGVEIWVTQAVMGPAVYTNFFAQSVNAGQQEWCDKFNEAHGAWAYKMDDEFNRLVGLRMNGTTAKLKSQGVS